MCLKFDVYQPEYSFEPLTIDSVDSSNVTGTVLYGKYGVGTVFKGTPNPSALRGAVGVSGGRGVTQIYQIVRMKYPTNVTLRRMDGDAWNEGEISRNAPPRINAGWGGVELVYDIAVLPSGACTLTFAYDGHHMGLRTRSAMRQAEGLKKFVERNADAILRDAPKEGIPPVVDEPPEGSYKPEERAAQQALAQVAQEMEPSDEESCFEVREVDNSTVNDVWARSAAWRERHERKMNEARSRLNEIRSRSTEVVQDSQPVSQ